MLRQEQKKSEDIILNEKDSETKKTLNELEHLKQNIVPIISKMVPLVKYNKIKKLTEKEETVSLNNADHTSSVYTKFIWLPDLFLNHLSNAIIPLAIKTTEKFFPKINLDTTLFLDALFLSMIKTQCSRVFDNKTYVFHLVKSISEYNVAVFFDNNLSTQTKKILEKSIYALLKKFLNYGTIELERIFFSKFIAMNKVASFRLFGKITIATAYKFDLFSKNFLGDHPDSINDPNNPEKITRKISYKLLYRYMRTIEEKASSPFYPVAIFIIGLYLYLSNMLLFVQEGEKRSYFSFFAATVSTYLILDFFLGKFSQTRFNPKIGGPFSTTNTVANLKSYSDQTIVSMLLSILNHETNKSERMTNQLNAEEVDVRKYIQEFEYYDGPTPKNNNKKKPKKEEVKKEERLKKEISPQGIKITFPDLADKTFLKNTNGVFVTDSEYNQIVFFDYTTTDPRIADFSKAIQSASRYTMVDGFPFLENSFLASKPGKGNWSGFKLIEETTNGNFKTIIYEAKFTGEWETIRPIFIGYKELKNKKNDASKGKETIDENPKDIEKAISHKKHLTLFITNHEGTKKKEITVCNFANVMNK